MATLHFICGKAGAGKTTLARKLGRTLPAVVFCEDEWLVTLGFEIRSLEDFESAGADHVLHVIEAIDSRCLANIHRRNDEKPPGIYWGSRQRRDLPRRDRPFHTAAPRRRLSHSSARERIIGHAGWHRMRHALLFLLIGLAVTTAGRLAAGQNPRPGIIGQDDRVRLDKHGPPWDAVGQVNVAGFD